MYSDSYSEQFLDFSTEEAIRKAVFNVELLHQVDVIPCFHELDRIIHESVLLILNNTNFVEKYLSNTIAEVATGSTHGRNIYEKDPTLEDDPDAEVVMNIQETRFLETSAKFLTAWALQDKNAVKRIAFEIKFLRVIFEELIENFLILTKDYQDICRQIAIIHDQLIKDPSRSKQKGKEYHALLRRCREIEAVTFSHGSALYGVCSHVQENMKAYVIVRNKIIRPYLRKVYKLAKQTANNEEQVLDNFQNGFLGLLRAISCYCPARQAHFASYAGWWIRQVILLLYKTEVNFFRLPISLIQTHTWLEKLKLKIEDPTEGEHHIKKLSKLSKMSVTRINSLYHAIRANQVWSLDSPMTSEDSDETVLVEVLEDVRYKERTEHQALEVDLVSKIKTLEPDQRVVICLCFGIFDLLPTRGEISPASIFRESIRQTSAKASLVL